MSFVGKVTTGDDCVCCCSGTTWAAGRVEARGAPGASKWEMETKRAAGVYAYALHLQV